MSKRMADIRQIAGEVIESTHIPTELFAKLARQLDTIHHQNWQRPIPSTEPTAVGKHAPRTEEVPD